MSLIVFFFDPITLSQIRKKRSQSWDELTDPTNIQSVKCRIKLDDVNNIQCPYE